MTLSPCNHVSHLQVLLERLDEALFGQDAHGLPERAHAREDEALGGQNVRGLGDLRMAHSDEDDNAGATNSTHVLDRVAASLDGVPHASDVAGTVIEQGHFFISSDDMHRAPPARRPRCAVLILQLGAHRSMGGRWPASK